MWTYDPAELTDTTDEGRKNIVRLLVGDTDENDPQLQDEEILFALGSNRDRVYVAALFGINAIISKYARLVNVELDEAIREDYSDLIKNYTALRGEITRKSKFFTGGIRIAATGLTVTDFDAAYDDPNRVRPMIEQHQFERINRYGIPYDGYHSVTT